MYIVFTFTLFDVKISRTPHQPPQDLNPTQSIVGYALMFSELRQTLRSVMQ